LSSISCLVQKLGKFLTELHTRAKNKSQKCDRKTVNSRNLCQIYCRQHLMFWFFSSFMTSTVNLTQCFVLAQGLDLTLFHQRLVVEVSVVHIMEIQVPQLIYHVLGFSCLSLQPLSLSPSRAQPRQHRCTFFKPCFIIIIFYCFHHTHWYYICPFALTELGLISLVYF